MHVTIVVLICFLLVGALPIWEYSNSWGILPITVLGTLSLVTFGLMWGGYF